MGGRRWVERHPPPPSQPYAAAAAALLLSICLPLFHSLALSVSFYPSSSSAASRFSAQAGIYTHRLTLKLTSSVEVPDGRRRRSSRRPTYWCESGKRESSVSLHKATDRGREGGREGEKEAETQRQRQRQRRRETGRERGTRRGRDRRSTAVRCCGRLRELARKCGRCSGVAERQRQKDGDAGHRRRCRVWRDLSGSVHWGEPPPPLPPPCVALSLYLFLCLCRSASLCLGRSISPVAVAAAQQCCSERCSISQPVRLERGAHTRAYTHTHTHTHTHTQARARARTHTQLTAFVRAQCYYYMGETARAEIQRTLDEVRQHTRARGLPHCRRRRCMSLNWWTAVTGEEGDQKAGEEARLRKGC